jgi:hypothetical protein
MTPRIRAIVSLACGVTIAAAAGAAVDPLTALPALPDGLEYRLVESDLVLWAAHANIVVNLCPDAILRAG